jgi:predicted transcriptional regulator
MSRDNIMSIDAKVRKKTPFGSAIMVLIQIALVIAAIVPEARSDPTRGSGEPLDVSYGGAIVTIDGTSSPGEWDDADEMLSLSMGTEHFSLKAKEDGERLLLYFSLDPDPEFALLDVYFDPVNGYGVSSEAFIADLWSSMAPREYQWTGGWTEVSPSGWNAIKGVDVIEMGIDFEKVSVVPGEVKNLSIAFRAISAVTYEEILWPNGYDGTNSSTWGSLTSSDLWDVPNAPPILRNGTGPTSFGFTEDTFHYSIVFEDPEGDTPVMRDIIIDGSRHAMEWIQDTGIGELYGFSTRLADGDHDYHFEFSDMEFTVRFPDQGEIEGPRVYVPNRAPVLDRPIPNGTYGIQEGQEIGLHIIDLEEFFSDDRDDGSLAFSVVYEEDPELIDMSVDGDYLDVRLKERDWFGSLSFQVEAADGGILGLPMEGYQLMTRSNVFNVVVTPINDAPQLTYLNRQISNDTVMVELRGPAGAVEDRPFPIEVRAADADLKIDATEKLTCTLNGPVIASTGAGRDNASFVFTPEDNDVGMTVWNVTVMDRFGAKDVIPLFVETQNINDRPYIVSCIHNGIAYPVESGRIVFGDGLSALDDEDFSIKVVARDDDMLGPGDGLTFGLTSLNDDVEIDPDTGELSFLPGQEDIGRRTIGVYVTDRSGAKDQVEIQIEVENVNDPPLIQGVYSLSGELRFIEGEDGHVIVTHMDPDIGYDPEEKLSVMWISEPLGKIGEGDRLAISGLAEGTHKITVFVTDRKGEQDSYTFTLVVEGDRTGNMDGFVLGLIIGGSVLVAAFCLGLLSLLSFSFFSRLKEKSILDNLNRRSIFEAIRTNSGIHFMALSEEVGLAKGVLAHHLNVLEKNEYIKSLQDSKYRRFYLFSEKIEYKLALTSIQQAIIYTVKQDPGISQSGISTRMGKSKMVINYHIKILRDVGLLSLERNGRETNCFLTSAAMDIS